MSDSQDLVEKTVRTIPFKGTDTDEFVMWSLKFMARAAVKGYEEILEGKIVPAEDGKSSYLPEETKTRNLHKQAYNDLILSMDGRACFKIVKTAVTKEFPKGSAKLAWANLYQKYQPSNKTSYIRLKNKFNNR